MRSSVGVALVSAVLAAATQAEAQPATQPGVRVDAREEHYVLGEPTLREVIARLNSMRLEGPDGRPSQGLTRYHIRPAWRTAASAGSCRVAALELHVRVTVTLPLWAAAAEAPSSERSRWERISGLIRDHEHTHRDITIDAAARLHDSLAALEAATCATLGRAIDAALAIAHEEITEAHRALDDATPERIVGAITES